jgi:hypothetical protein
VRGGGPRVWQLGRVGFNTPGRVNGSVGLMGRGWPIFAFAVSPITTSHQRNVSSKNIVNAFS